MGHALIWLEGAAVLLLLMALVVAWAARRRRRWAQLGLTVLAAILLLLPGAVAAWAAGGLRFGRELGLPHNWFFYALSWLLAGLLGVVLVCRWGLAKSSHPANRFSARFRMASRFARVKVPSARYSSRFGMGPPVDQQP